MKNEFNYYLPVNIIFGAGKLNEIGHQASKLGKKALLVTGTGSTKKTGVLDRCISLLSANNVQCVVFNEVTQNPLTSTVYKGRDMGLHNNCDFVIGLGGGSIMDAAKAIAFCMENEGDVSDYIFAKKQSDKAKPILLVPTTCGTGSEGNSFAVLTNPLTKDKKSLRLNAIIPKCSIVDPELMLTMPQQVLASVGFDAFCHNLEAYTANNAQPFTDMVSFYALKLLANSLVKAVEQKDMQAITQLTFASTLGGMAINTAGVGAAHGMEHPVSGLYNVVHGKGLAALMPEIIKQSYKNAPQRFDEIAKLFGAKNNGECANVVKNLISELNLTCNLTDLGVKETDIDWLVENCTKVSTPSINNNPRVFSTNEIKQIYTNCL